MDFPVKEAVGASGVNGLPSSSGGALFVGFSDDRGLIFF
jgi:hypothetical protein